MSITITSPRPLDFDPETIGYTTQQLLCIFNAYAAYVNCYIDLYEDWLNGNLTDAEFNAAEEACWNTYLNAKHACLIQ